MAIHPFQSEAISRGARMLRTAFGPAIARFLEDPAIIEVMLNPDGRLWIDRLSGGLAETTERLSAPDGERIVRLVAHHVGAEVHAGSPRVSAELPETGERFEGLLPPVVAAPAFAIRKPAVAVFTLDDYVAAGIMTLGQASALKVEVEARKNILVAGGRCVVDLRGANPSRRLHRPSTSAAPNLRSASLPYKAARKHRQLFAARFQIKLHLQQWVRASAAPRAPCEQLVD